MFEDLHNYIYHLNTTGGVPLKGTGIVVGLALIIAHVFALLKKKEVQSFLKAFPRDYKWGVILLSIDFVWAMMAMTYMDMGEFYTLRTTFLMIIPVSFVLVLIYVREFLAVRALGSLMLLISGVVLAAAFLQPQTSRLLIPILAYAAWVIPGMYFVGMPFLMRDAVTWVTANDGRWKAASLAGAIYGAVLLAAAVLWY